MAIAIGFDIGVLVKELQIKEDRIKDLHDLFTTTIENHNSDPIEDLHRFIAYTTKANELVFLTFLSGVAVGTKMAIEATSEQIPTIMKQAALVGAQHHEEVIRIAREEGMIGATTATSNTSPEKKKQQPEDVMYG